MKISEDVTHCSSNKTLHFFHPNHSISQRASSFHIMQNSLCQCFLTLKLCLQPACELPQKMREIHPFIIFFFFIFLDLKPFVMSLRPPMPLLVLNSYYQVFLFHSLRPHTRLGRSFSISLNRDTGIYSRRLQTGG